MGLLGYGLMSFLAIVYEVFKVLFLCAGCSLLSQVPEVRPSTPAQNAAGQ